MPPFQLIAFDADDTLWHNERLYVRAQQRLKALLQPYVAEESLDERLFQTEMHNLEHFGYGIKAFALSMIETAIEITGGRISAGEIQQIIAAAREMLLAEVEVFEHVDDVLGLLGVDHTLMLITKGDLRDQEIKLARSGLAERFGYVEIVSDKTTDTYRAILGRHNVAPGGFLMVGNSLRSDILPVLELGASAVYIPQELAWVHESAEPPPASQPDFYELRDISELPALVARLEQGQGR